MLWCVSIYYELEVQCLQCLLAKTFDSLLQLDILPSRIKSYDLDTDVLLLQLVNEFANVLDHAALC